MSCESAFDESDPASLDQSLISRMPDVDGKAAVYLRDAAREFFRRSTVWRDQLTYLQCNVDQQMYTLPTPLAGKIVKVVDAYYPDQAAETANEGYDFGGGWCSPVASDLRIARDSEVSDRHEQQRWYQPKPTTFYLHRPIGQAVTLRLSIVLTTNGESGDAAMIEEYREGILSGAQYLATMAKGVETQDRQVAMAHKVMFDEAIERAERKYTRQLRSERKPMSRTRAMNEGNRR